MQSFQLCQYQKKKTKTKKQNKQNQTNKKTKKKPTNPQLNTKGVGGWGLTLLRWNFPCEKPVSWGDLNAIHKLRTSQQAKNQSLDLGSSSPIVYDPWDKDNSLVGLFKFVLFIIMAEHKSDLLTKNIRHGDFCPWGEMEQKTTRPP